MSFYDGIGTSYPSPQRGSPRDDHVMNPDSVLGHVRHDVKPPFNWHMDIKDGDGRTFEMWSSERAIVIAALEGIRGFKVPADAAQAELQRINRRLVAAARAELAGATAVKAKGARKTCTCAPEEAHVPCGLPVALPPESEKAVEVKALIGDAERDATITALRDHFAAGRLTMDEADERVTTALAARHQHELDMLMADLPEAVLKPAKEVISLRKQRDELRGEVETWRLRASHRAMALYFGAFAFLALLFFTMFVVI